MNLHLFGKTYEQIKTSIDHKKTKLLFSMDYKYNDCLTLYIFIWNDLDGGVGGNQNFDFPPKCWQAPWEEGCFQDPMYAIFIKSRGFKDFKYYIGCLLVMTKTKTETKTKTKTRFYALLGLNIFQGSIFSRSEYFLGVNIKDRQYFPTVYS